MKNVYIFSRRPVNIERMWYFACNLQTSIAATAAPPLSPCWQSFWQQQPMEHVEVHCRSLLARHQRHDALRASEEGTDGAAAVGHCEVEVQIQIQFNKHQIWSNTTLIPLVSPGPKHKLPFTRLLQRNIFLKSLLFVLYHIVCSKPHIETRCLPAAYWLARP